MIGMTVTAANRTMIDLVGVRTQEQKWTTITDTEVGIIWNSYKIHKGLEPWFNDYTFAKVLKAITGEHPPNADTSSTTIWKNNKEARARYWNEAKSRNQKVYDYLNKHYLAIYYGLDDLRNEHGAKALPLFYGAMKGISEVGDSRAYRKKYQIRRIDAVLDLAAKLQEKKLEFAEALKKVKN